MATTTTTPNVSQAIDRQLRAQEKAFHGTLLQIYETSILPLTKGYLPLELIQQKYAKRIKTKIRHLVSDSYWHGIGVVDDHVRRHIPDHDVYMSGRDIDYIKRRTDLTEEHFWKIVDKLYVRDYTIDKPNFDYKSGMQRVAIKATYSAFSEAVRSKYLNAMDIRPTAADRMGFSLRGFLADIKRGFTRSKLKVRWETAQDSKVCQTGVEPWNCKRHDGEEFDANDPGLPEVPAHDFCRCRLVPVDEGEGFTEKLKGLLGF